MSHESINKSDEWYTPKYIFDALECSFDLDCASPVDRKYCCVPALNFITARSLELEWNGFCWLNPPFEGRNDKTKWLEKMAKHGSGIVLTPDRSSTDWWQDASIASDALLNIRGKVKFIRADGSIGSQPSNGTTLFGYGRKAVYALLKAEKNGLGKLLTDFNPPHPSKE